MFSSNNITENIAKKISEKEDLNREEETILKEDYKIAKMKLLISKISMFIIIFVEIIFFFYIGYRVTTALNILKEETSDIKKEHVTVIDVDKPISDSYADTFISNFHKVSKEKNIKSIIVRLRSPGGTPSAAWNIATTLKDFQDTNKKIPLYIYVDSAAVSGSYMIASQIDTIYSNPFALIGSIGVIMEHLVFEDISKKIGIGQETLTAGKYKKMISSFKYLSKSDKDRLQKTILNVMYNNFLSVVAEGRHISIDKLKNYAEGKVYVANDPTIKDILVDKILTWPKMKNLVKKENKLDKDIDFVRFNSKTNKGLSSLIGSSVDMNLNMNLDKNELSFK